MSGILVLSYRLKKVTNSYVFHCFLTSKNVHISATKCLIEMGFGSKCSILNGQVIYVEKSKLNIAAMLLIPLERVTYIHQGVLARQPKSGPSFNVVWLIDTSGIHRNIQEKLRESGVHLVLGHIFFELPLTLHEIKLRTPYIHSLCASSSLHFIICQHSIF